MTKESKNTAQDKEGKKPDYTVRQYRYAHAKNGGMKVIGETIGAGWLNAENGSINLRLNGRQIIDNDLFIFPKQEKDVE